MRGRYQFKGRNGQTYGARRVEVGPNHKERQILGNIMTMVSKDIL